MSVEQSIVLDNGSGLTKAGMSGANCPQVVFPSIIGRSRMPTVLMNAGQKAFYVGDEAQIKRGILSLEYPIQRGIVKDWDDMEKLWQYTFSSALKVDPEAHKILLTESPWNPKSNREKMVEMMFEKFKVPSVYIANPGVLSLHAIGKTTGLVMDSGDGVTNLVPVFGGYCISPLVHRINFGGREVTDYLARILTERGLFFTTMAEKEVVRDIKEKLSYTAEDYEAELKEANQSVEKEEKYELPDGQIITLNSERFRCGEVLFKPELIGMDSQGIANAAYNTIMACDVDLRKSMFQNIVLSGGNSMFPNMAQRLVKDIQELVPLSVEVNCFAPPERKYSVWIGGAILASLLSFSPMWITNAEYFEVGSNIVHQKCL